MYQFIRGVLVEKTPTEAVLEAGGIGYALHIPLSTFSALPALGQEVKILTHFVVREDAHALYGFAEEEERELFRYLISVSGIGPKVALTTLSGVPLTDLKMAIAEGSVETLTRIPGIGRKTAERLIVELREKMVVERLPAGGSADSGGKDPVVEDSVQALVSLGYKKASARAAVEKVVKEGDAGGMAVEELIRASLKAVR